MRARARVKDHFRVRATARARAGARARVGVRAKVRAREGALVPHGHATAMVGGRPTEPHVLQVSSS